MENINVSNIVIEGMLVPLCIPEREHESTGRVVGINACLWVVCQTYCGITTFKHSTEDRYSDERHALVFDDVEKATLNDAAFLKISGKNS